MTQEPGSHLDLETVADLDADLLPPDTAAAARAHLTGCDACSRMLGRLRTTRGLLSAMPAEAAPADVAARMDEALRHEQEAAVPRGTVLPTARRRPWSGPAVAGAAAVVAVLVLVGAVVAGAVSDRGHHGSGSRVTSASGDGSNVTRRPAVKRWATGRDYTPATLATFAPGLVTATPPATAAPTPSGAAPTSSPDALTLDALRASPAGVVACSRILAGGAPTVPLAVDFARFQHKPAAVFVLTAPGHPESLDVWVVRTVCSTSSLDFYFRRVPRG